jgi:hypothetical protein
VLKKKIDGKFNLFLKLIKGHKGKKKLINNNNVFKQMSLTREDIFY